MRKEKTKCFLGDIIGNVTTHSRNQNSAMATGEVLFSQVKRNQGQDGRAEITVTRDPDSVKTFHGPRGLLRLRPRYMTNGPNTLLRSRPRRPAQASHYVSLGRILSCEHLEFGGQQEDVTWSWAHCHHLWTQDAVINEKGDEWARRQWAVPAF